MHAAAAPPAEAWRTAAPQPEPLRRTPVCTTGCPLLDRLLHGGIPGGSITELVGESTVGKTQLCLQLLLTAQLPEAAGGLAGRALYISTEGHAPLGRLASLAEGYPSLRAPCDSVLVANASGPEQLYDAVQQAAALAAAAEQSPPVRLIVIDSITNPFRELDAACAEDMAHRSRLLYQLACLLKETAHRHQVAVVVVNHVVDCSEEATPPVALVALEQATGGRALRTSGRRVMPALGLHWAHCVSTRLFLSRATAAGALGVGEAVTRHARVVFAPHLPPARCAFAVTAAGVRGVEEPQPDSPT